VKNKGFIYALVMLLLISFASLTGCGEKSSGNNTSTKENQSSTKKDSVTLVLDTDVATFDPSNSASLDDSQVYVNIYDQLVNVDKDGKFVPVLAESWDVSTDGKKYTFHIRKGVKFHNGEELKASDVVFSFETAKKSPYLSGQFSEIGEVKAIDDYTVEVNLQNSFAPFLLSLYDNFYVLNEKAVKNAGDKYGEQPVGTGPYKFVKHNTGVDVVLERFDDYWGGKAPIKNVVYKIITDQNTALIALKTGEVDFLYEIPAISRETVKSNKKLSLIESSTIRLSYVIMNVTAKPFDNVKVRQAINYAIDKKKAITVATEGLATPTDSIFSKDIFGYSEIKGYEYNTQRAKDLLAEAGYPNGFSVTLKTMAGPLEKVIQSVQEDLGKIGITAKIEVGEKNAYIQALQKGDYAIGDISCSVGSDADYYSILFGTGSQANFSKYSNAKVDDLFKNGRETTDNKQRAGIYHELAQLISDDAVIVPLYYPINLSAGNANLNVGYIDPIELLNVNEMSWK
jgi:ABC-type dipeptide transport system, periplasmic component